MGQHPHLSWPELNQPDTDNLFDEFFVCLTIEFGYRNCFWFPRMPPHQLGQWWRDLQTVAPYYQNPKRLPGQLVNVSEEWVELYWNRDRQFYSAHLFCDEYSELWRPDGTIIYHKGRGGE